MFLHILHRGRLPSAIAPETAVVTVDQLLLRERQELALLDEVVSLDGCSGGEGPAGATSTLIFDLVDSSFCSPVDGGRKIGWKTERRRLHLNRPVQGSVAKKLSVLSIRPGGKLVVTHFEGVFGIGIDFLVLGIFPQEDGLAKEVLFPGSIGDAELGNMLHEEWVDGSLLVAEVVEAKSFADGEHIYQI